MPICYSIHKRSNIMFPRGYSNNFETVVLCTSSCLIEYLSKHARKCAYVVGLRRVEAIYATGIFPLGDLSDKSVLRTLPVNISTN